MEHLPPIPGLIRRDPGHTYWLNDRPFAVSVTGVLRVQKTDYAMERIQATTAIWAPRGNNTHRALELFLHSRIPRHLDSAGDPAELGELRSGDHADWIAPLLQLPIWDQVEPIATERATCCLVRGVAGTYDLAYLDPGLPPSPFRPAHVSGPARVLADLKTLGTETAHTYSVEAQLGGYMALEATHGVWYDYGHAIWAWPGRARFGELYSRRQCLVAWAAVWARWQAAHCVV